MNGNGAVIYINKDTCIVKTANYIGGIALDTPSFIILTFNVQVTSNSDSATFNRFFTVFTPTVSFLDGNAITTVTTFHGDVGANAIQSNAFSTFYGRVKPNSISQGVTTFHSFGNDVQLTICAININTTFVASKNTYWGSNVIFNLDL